MDTSSNNRFMDYFNEEIEIKLTRNEIMALMFSIKHPEMAAFSRGGLVKRLTAMVMKKLISLMIKDMPMDVLMPLLKDFTDGTADEKKKDFDMREALFKAMSPLVDTNKKDDES